MIHYITTEGVANATVVNELRAVKKAGIPFILHSMRLPKTTFFTSPDTEVLNQSTNVIYPIKATELFKSLLLAPLQYRSRFFIALLNALFGPRESLIVRIKAIWHFLVACVWARSINKKVSLIHSQWIHSCGSIGMYGAWLLDVPFSFTGHAADLFRERAALVDKIKQAEFIICISSFHKDFYQSLGAEPEKLKIVYCGINTSHFKPKILNYKKTGRFKILSAGRLVEKKGFIYLIGALRILSDRGMDLECIIAGSGELENALKKYVTQLKLNGVVKITGEPLMHEKIPEFFHSGDCYCLPCVWASDNDVDGLPQMLMEAMACELPVISTKIVGIPDLVDDDRNGLLVPPNDVEALVNAIEKLYNDPELGRKLAIEGRKTVLEKFNLATCLSPLLSEFSKKLVDSDYCATGQEINFH